MVEFGRTLRFVIKRKLHLSVREFADRAGVSTNTVTRAMRMRSSIAIRPETFRRFAAGAKMSTEAFDRLLETAEAELRNPTSVDAAAFAGRKIRKRKGGSK